MQARLPLHYCASAVLLAATVSTQCLAQPPATLTSRVTITHVKPDMLNEWLDLQKNEIVPALKKAGVKTRTVYASALFGTAGEYLIVTPFEKYAEFDGDSPTLKALGPVPSARLGEKLRKCIVSSNSFAATRLGDLSNVIDGASPAVAVFVRYRISTGKMQDFQNLVKSDLLPVYKKAKVNFTVSRRGVGANPNDVSFVIGQAKYADLDGGTVLVKQLGQEGADKVNAKFNGMRNLIEVVVRRRVPDLSF